MSENSYICSSESYKADSSESESKSPISDPDYVSPDRLFIKTETRRGRPKAAMINNLILEGASSQSGIRCEICSRVFPRDKSLQAHRRVHTGERPYSCDYPGCMRKFKQSGQLKTHQRLHTGERPFLCSFPGCDNRFTHANRHCTKHPAAPLTRCDDFKPQDPLIQYQPQEVQEWLQRYMTERKQERKKLSESSETEKFDGLDSTPLPKPVENNARTTELSDMTNFQQVTTIKTPPVSTGYYTSVSNEGSIILSPRRRSPMKSVSGEMKARPVKNLFADGSPRKRELPKKRWLRIASKEQEQNANQSRPTVLRLSGCPLTPATPASGNGGAEFTSPKAVLFSSPPFLTPPYSSEKCLLNFSNSLVGIQSPRLDSTTDDHEILAVPLSSHEAVAADLHLSY